MRLTLWVRALVSLRFSFAVFVIFIKKFLGLLQCHFGDQIKAGPLARPGSWPLGSSCVFDVALCNTAK